MCGGEGGAMNGRYGMVMLGCVCVRACAHVMVLNRREGLEVGIRGEEPLH